MDKLSTSKTGVNNIHQTTKQPTIIEYSMKADSVGATISTLSLFLDSNLPVKLTTIWQAV